MAAESHRTMEGRRLLFVDDRFIGTRLYMERCRSRGAEISYASTLLDAFEHLTSATFDVAVLDLHMPAPRKPYPSRYRESIQLFVDNKDSDVRAHNLGQMIGHYITSNLEGKPPFFYLSAVARYFVPLDMGDGNDPTCFDRNTTTPAEIARYIEALLS